MIDAHQHYWNPARGDYDWMPMDNPILARPYSPDDLIGDLSRHGIHRTVLVQAAATVVETEYMLGIADATPSVAGVVGWVDFENPADRATLARLAGHPKFKGVRPMIQDIPDVDWMLRDDVQWGFEAVVENDLALDALGFPRHLENFYKIFTRHSDMRVVIDHCMKPQIRDHSDTGFSEWADGMAALAETGAFCKFSGLVTECDGWSLEKIEPYACHVLETFGAERVMWGSDWPVCQLEASYSDWRAAAEALTAHLTDAERAEVFGGTAARFYRL
ncbi:amidohydrolase family protein [Rhodobacterales bacterium HKCCE2091]|nr:amidohydrolase family protein [Rhodobacterales bacterium HKCCE2091]